MHHEITEKNRLLGKDGNIIEPGYAKSMLPIYDRKDILAHKSRIKEWDYYYVSNKKYALCVTVADMGYVGALSISIIDFVEPSQFTNSSIFLFPMGKLKMPSTSEIGDIYWKNGQVEMKFTCEKNMRHLTGIYPNADKKGTTVKFDVFLTEFPDESMVIATPFDKDRHFYFNQKINCMRAEGQFSLNDRILEFDPSDSLGTLDWGRGVWTFDNTWYWGSLQTRLADGSTFGFNLGYGFGNPTAASEDMLFYNGKAHKIGRSAFVIRGDKEDKPDFMAKWRVVSDDGRIECSFIPLIDRYEPFDLKVMCMIPHQVFGYFSGKCVLDDGTVIELDRELGFAEKVNNKW